MHGKNKISAIANLDWMLLIPSVLLMGLGCLAVARAENLVGEAPRLWRMQVVWSGFALAAMLLTVLPSYRVLRRFAYVLFGISLVALVAVLFTTPINGAHRWLRIGGLGLQPSEFVKVVFILALAHWLMYRDKHRRLVGLLLPLLLTMVPVLLILREPDLGTSMLFLPVMAAMLVAAGARRRDLSLVFCVGLLMLPVLWSQMSREQKSRVTAVWNQSSATDRPDADRYHLHRAKRMMAVGGVWGTALAGPATADTTYFYVPAAATDSIMCVVIERYGLWGLAVLLLVYSLLVARMLAVARDTNEPFGRLVAVGIATLFGAEAIINLGMMAGLFPITGMSLPLISYGGSGLVAHAIAIGLVLNIGMRRGYEVAGNPFRFVRATTAPNP